MIFGDAPQTSSTLGRRIVVGRMSRPANMLIRDDFPLPGRPRSVTRTAEDRRSISCFACLRAAAGSRSASSALRSLSITISSAAKSFMPDRPRRPSGV